MNSIRPATRHLVSPALRWVISRLAVGFVWGSVMGAWLHYPVIYVLGGALLLGCFWEDTIAACRRAWRMEHKP